MRKLALFFTCGLCVLFCSCGKSVKWIPENDSSKWVEYKAKVGDYTLRYKYPGADGLKNYRYYKEIINLSKLKNENYLCFVAGRYDYTEYPHFELSIALSKYRNVFSEPPMADAVMFTETPTIDSFIKEHIGRLEPAIKSDGENLEYSKKDINGVPYLNILFYNKSKRIRTEVFATPLTKEYYLDIMASYEDDYAKNPDWLASRRKIFEEFAENVKLIPPLHYQKKNSE